MESYLSKKEILSILKSERAFLKKEFGVVDIGLFGSYAKGTQSSDSDIDFLVEFEEPRFEWVAGLLIYLEKKFNRRIELVRKSINVNNRLKERIAEDVIYA